MNAGLWGLPGLGPDQGNPQALSALLPDPGQGVPWWSGTARPPPPSCPPSAYSVSTFTKGPSLSRLHPRKAPGLWPRTAEPARSQHLLSTYYVPAPCQEPRVP